MAVTDGVAVGVAVGDAAPDRRRSINRSPACHGCDATLHVSVPAVASTVAADAASDSVSSPSIASTSSVCPVNAAYGASVSTTDPPCHVKDLSDADEPPTVNALGFSAPFVPSAPNPAPMATGSKNASCAVLVGAVTVTTQGCSGFGA